MKFELSFTLPDIDKFEIEIQCSICHMRNTVTLGQVRLEEFIICCGCHYTIQLVDNLSGVQHAKQLIDHFKLGK